MMDYRKLDDEGTRMLARAIIVSATDDYRRRLKNQGNGRAEEPRLKAIENFFHSKWFSLLSGNMDPDYLIQRLRGEMRREE